MTEKLLLVVTVTTLCMLSPGPDMFLVMRNTLAGDRRYGGLTAFGVLTGNIIHIGYCVLGIGLLLSQNRLAYNALRLASAAYLIYLGVQSLRASPVGAAAEPTEVSDGMPKLRHRNAYLQGFINNVLNPKGSLFYLGVFSQLITPDTSLPQTALLIAAMVGVSAAFWLVFVSALHAPVIRIRIQKYGVAIDRMFGVVLILFAIKLAALS